MRDAQNGLERIKNCKKDLAYYVENCEESALKQNESVEELEKFKTQFEAAMDDDFNTANAITAIYELVRFTNKAIKEDMSKELALKTQDMLNHLCDVLGIAEMKESQQEDTAEIEELIAKRTEAKKNKDFETADAIREQLANMGITIKDTRQGVQWFRG